MTQAPIEEQQKWASSKLAPIMAKHAINDIDFKYLVHYCGSKSAHAIISNRNLLFSPLYSMNDSKEFYFMYNEIFRSLNNKMHYIKSYCPIHISNFLATLHQELTQAHNFQSNNGYIFCASAANEVDDIDKLSMWRAYASDGEGCALIFNADVVLAEPNENQFPISGWRVHYYDEESAINKSNDIINDIITLINTITEADIAKYGPGLITMICAKIGDFCMSAKHSGFREENEVRLIYRKEYDLDNLFQPYACNMSSSITPRISVPIKKYQHYGFETSLEKSLQGVMVGPSPNQSQIQNALDILINSSIEEEEKKPLLRSKTPYRSK